MRNLYLIFLLSIVSGSICAQTNVYPASGNVGLGTTTPTVPLHIKPTGSTSVWLGLDKNSGMETGIQFLKTGTVQFYVYTDNEDNDALKIQSTIVSGENDAYPRIFIPNNNRDLYFGLSGGNVAIGHKAPYFPSRLHIKANMDSHWSFISEAASNDQIIGMSHDGTNGMISTSYLGSSGFSPLQFQTSNVPRLTITVDGNVGIGTPSPNEKLTVNGTIYGKEIKVDLSVPGPDYVFEKDYPLQSLEEIEDFIGQNKHLPEVPSAIEMEANGIKLGEMNMLLLKKIEELTLYVIQLQNENEKQDKLIEQLQNQK